MYPSNPINDFDLDGRATRNYGVCVGFIITACGALIFDDSGVKYSLGGGLGFPGAGGSITYGKGSASSGWSATATAGYGIVYSGTYQGRANSEVGIGGRGGSLTVQYTAALTRKTFIGQGKGYAPKKDTRYLQNLRSGKLKKDSKSKSRRKWR